MTNSPPPEPNSPQKSPLGFDEFIGIFVAFTTIGTIFFWALGRDGGFKGFPTLVESPQTVAPATVSPAATAVPIAPVDESIATPTAPATDKLQQSQIEEPRVQLPRPETKPAIPLVVVPPRPRNAASDREVKFTDVPDDFWARPFIVDLQKRGIVNGFPGGYFRPNQAVTRAEFAALLQKAFNRKPTQTVEKFSDVPEDFWAVPAIEKATSTGFLQGYPGNIFQPKQQIPRAQAVVALASGLNLKTPADPDKILQTYKDAAEIPDYAKAKVAAATEAGLVVSHPEPKSFKPNQNASRAEVTAFIYQALVRANRAKKINSKYIVQTK